MSAAPMLDLGIHAARVRLAEAAKCIEAERGPAEVTSLRGRGEWTVIDRFEINGRAYVVAQQNDRPTGLDALSPREREIVERAVRGDTQKVIAYDLGIAHSTVRVLLARSYRRLGVRSHAELVARIGGSERPATP
jgi:DNA-binding CsgD family transcriptional regulator